MKKIKSIRREVESILCSAESISVKRALILLSISTGQNKYSAILGDLRKHDSRLGITKVKNDIKALNQKGLLLILKEEGDSDTVMITNLGANVLAQIEINFPEKLLSKKELEKLSQETQKTMIAKSI